MIEGIALELRIKSIKYFDLDSISQTNVQSKGAESQSSNNATPSLNLRNTTKSFNIEGLTVYFDEFIIKDEVDTENLTSLADTTFGPLSQIDSNDEVNADDATFAADQTTPVKPQDESPPFNYELNSEYYLYTNPIIFITFSGIQTIKLTINNMRPSDLIMEAAAAAAASNLESTGASSLTTSTILSQQSQRPLMELNAQFGSIKSLLCPKQIHLLIDMITKLTDYVEAANAIKKARSTHRANFAKRFSNSAKPKKHVNYSMSEKPIRGCDKRKYEALIQNNLMYNNANFSNEILVQNDNLLNEDEDPDDTDETDNYKSIFISQPGLHDNEQSVMFYSMMSESTAFNANTNINMSHMTNSVESTGIDGKFYFFKFQSFSKKEF